MGNSTLYAVMSDGDVTAVAGKAIWVTLQLGGPVLIVGLVIGLVVSIFQAVTQIQEQTLTFVPKIIAVFLVLLITGGWMISSVEEWTEQTWKDVAALVRT